MPPTPIAPSMSSMVRWWRILYYKKYVLKIITQNSNSHLLSADESVSIKNVNADNAPDATIYNLNGQRMKKPAKGLYIISGRKYAVR